ncbi:MAG: flagellar biosynthesis protein FlhB [Rhodospirillaceae bacterium]|nr:flagellar biosynthesis protein FlhB [Rhodospirillaceae bacterium]
MAEENQDGQEKTEEPTQRRIDKAAEEGRVLTSKEVMVFTSLAMGFVLFLALGRFMPLGLSIWGSLFVFDSALNLDTLGLVKVRYAFWLVILVTFVVGVPLIIVTLLTQIGVGGLNFSTQALHFKGNRIDPLAGLKRIFSIKGLVELAKSVLKVALLFGIGGVIIYMQLPELIQLSASSLGQSIERASAAVPYVLGGLLVGLFIIAVIDFAWQQHTHTQSLRMTIKEVKDESRQTEGSPEVRAKIRRMQYQQSQESAKQRDALGNVTDATVVITNPTHFAVALKYASGQMGAPTVLAMGRGVMAQQIIEKAEAHDVRTLRIPMLARALFFTSEIGGEITEGLYNAVAVILAYVFRINNDETLEMPDLTLPPELRFDEYGNLETEPN